MRSLEKSLFKDGDLSAGLRAQLSKAVPERVQKVAESVLRARPEHELAAELASELAVVPLELFRDKASLSKEEVQVDVSGDSQRMFLRPGPFYVPGVRVVVTIPYKGDADLWLVRPSTFQYSAPRAEIQPARDGEGVIRITLEQPSDQPPEMLKGALDQRLKDIEFFIASQATDLAGHHGQLEQAIERAVVERRARLAKHDSISSLLGIPEVPVVSAAGSSITSNNNGSRAGASVRNEESGWDVFISHASEDKDAFVRPLAIALRAAGLRVWFDEMTLKVGDSLRRSIDYGLSKSKFGVVVISEAFLRKEWPQRELDGLVALEVGDRKIVLPIWHDISASAVRRKSPTLADRLAISSSRGVEEVTRELLEVVRLAVAVS